MEINAIQIEENFCTRCNESRECVGYDDEFGDSMPLCRRCLIIGLELITEAEDDTESGVDLQLLRS